MKTQEVMTKQEQIKQAIQEGNIHYCKSCKKKQPVRLTYLDPDQDTEATLIVCCICHEGIDFIENM